MTAPTDVRCTMTATPEPATVPAAGGTGAVVVQTNRDCTWNARAESSWITLSTASGQGEGRVGFSAAPNRDPVTRRASILLNDVRAEIAQAAAECRFELGSRAATVPASGGSGEVAVSASSVLCSWTASADSSWIALASGTSGQGNGTVRFAVAAWSGPARTGTITIAGHPFAVTQTTPAGSPGPNPPGPPPNPPSPPPNPPAPGACTFAVSPLEVELPKGGGTGRGTLTIDTTSQCEWTTSNPLPWLSVEPRQGRGRGSVRLAAESNARGSARSGRITVAGQQVTVHQK